MQPVLDNKRLKEQREKLHITRIAASNRMNITQSTYVRYENGDRNPTYATVIRMAQILGTSAEYLTGQTDDPSPAIIYFTKDDPVSFEIARSASEMTPEQLKHLAEYCKKIKSGK